MKNQKGGLSKVLEQLETAHQITQDGKQWLTLALDPFHDYAVTPQGVPDQQSAPSLVMVYTSAVSISKPASAAGNWDCCVANLPILSPVSSSGTAFADSQSTDGAFHFQSTPPKDPVVAPVVINSADTGQPLFPDSAIAAWAPTNFDSVGLANLPDGVTHDCRVAAWGIEVTNTTSDLYKQGNSTTGTIFQDNLHNFDVAYYVDDDAVVPTQFMDFHHFYSPPALLAEASQSPDCVTHKAADGIYMQVQLAGSDINLNKRFIPLFHHVSSTGGVTLGFASKGKQTSSTTEQYASVMRTANVNSSYCFFSGLSNETTLRVVSRCIVEIFPKFNQTYLQLATPSSPYDPKALELYDSLKRCMPPGVPVGFNAKGDFWRMLGTVAKDVVPMVFPLLDKVAPGLGSALGFVYPTVIEAAEKVVKTAKKRRRNNRRGGSSPSKSG